MKLTHTSVGKNNKKVKWWTVVTVNLSKDSLDDDLGWCRNNNMW